jgi:hypothetical protein
MIAAPSDNAMEEEQFAYANVPLHRDYLRQASLFDERDYPLPAVLPGGEAVIVDADDWTHNFKKGRVTAYNYATGLHIIRFAGVSEVEFFGREIRKPR